MSDAGPAARWSPGDLAVLRYITRPGAPGMAWPCRVAEDREDLLALYLAKDTEYLRWGRDAAGQRALVPDRWRRDVLRLMFPGEPYSVWVFWEVDDDGARRFTAFYINMEEPFRRTAIGVDTNDHVLDVVVAPDRTWRWKDSDELDERVRDRIYSPGFAASLRAGAAAVIAKLEANEPPFSDGWEHWTPEPEWDVPALPADWQQVPATLWPRRSWAYLDI